VGRRYHPLQKIPAISELTARHVQQALSALADTRSTATISLIHNCLTRAIQRAERHDLVRRG
jgi:hypothetical protein